MIRKFKMNFEWEQARELNHSRQKKKKKKKKKKKTSREKWMQTIHILSLDSSDQNCSQ
jgi:hypothetical protein